MVKRVLSAFEKYPVLGEIFRFLLVGGVATLIDFFVMGVTLYVFEPSAYPNFFGAFIDGENRSSIVANMVGTGLGFTVGMVVNYCLSILFVFIYTGRAKSALGFLSFALLSAVGLLLHLLGMFLLNELLGVNEWVVKILMTAVVLVYNYLSKKAFIFKKQANEKGRGEKE